MKAKTPAEKIAHSIVGWLTKNNPYCQEELALLIEYKRVIEKLHNTLLEAGFISGKDFQLKEGDCLWFAGEAAKELEANAGIKNIYENLLHLIGRIDKFQAKTLGPVLEHPSYLAGYQSQLIVKEE